MRGTVLVVDDDADAAEALAETLRARDFRAISECDPEQALIEAMNEDIDVVLTDLSMSAMDGLVLCQRLAAARPGLPVVVVTGHASIDSAIGALRVGAFDFVLKPADPALLAVVVERAVGHHRLKNELHRLRTAVAESRGFDKLLGESPAMQRVFDVIARIAPTQATVLVTGESGTGKELVARAIHENSPRRDGPFVAINCGAVPATLLESELFGHAKGAFTDAKTSRRGLFLEAQGGTLFLDEIGEMPLEMQVKLLRALQERTVRAVGSNVETPFDARVIAATNRDLEKDVAEKRFREDLYYRIHVCAIHVPPLRERERDVPILARAFVTRFARLHGHAVEGIAPAALTKLMEYPWPGNVRELENGIERAVAMAQYQQLVVDDLPERVRARRNDHDAPLLPSNVTDLVTADAFELRYIVHVLSLVKGNKARAARILGFDRRTLYRKLDGSPTDPRERSGTRAVPTETEASPPAVARPAVTAIADPAVATPARSRKSILVVDDDPECLEHVQVLLEARGYHVSTATGVADAMRTRAVDIVLTDMCLGDGSGTDLVGRFGAAPVVAMTGRVATKEDDAAGFGGWLVKPISLTRLTTMLAQALAP